MQEGMEKSIRYRINVTTSVKGVMTFECTVDAENYEMADVLRKSDELTAELKKRYPLAIA
jgi:hypothetical protein